MSTRLFERTLYPWKMLLLLMVLLLGLMLDVVFLSVLGRLLKAEISVGVFVIEAGSCYVQSQNVSCPACVISTHTQLSWICDRT